ncbi:hypothetical protein WOLCODRAFT_143751 [Wolfiporia cocos MD-104 SS10]|uniref:RING-type domain-containing protein n=1 Tax=Wolfiporia cocos (strain MD-104) TaxID=742152 RepID=A0A2H3K026_WOLCO|nr:hypothetical protein WOLCODRAFT_143751 [Wolfiporia cocos MD-104 SS10]
MPNCNVCRQALLDHAIAQLPCGHVCHNHCVAHAGEAKCQTCGLKLLATLTVGGAVVATAALPVVAPAALGVVGFGSAGPVAGTYATAIHAGIGNVAAGSLFASCQSVAMGGAIPTLWSATAAAFGGAAGAGAGALRLRDGGELEQ